RRDKPPTYSLRPIIPATASSLCITPAAGTYLAAAASAGTVTFASSLLKEVYKPKAVIPHAASLHLASAHCAILSTAASPRTPCPVSVLVWPVALSGRLTVIVLVSHYLTNKLIGRESIPHR